MSTFGKVDEYVQESEDWIEYVERMRHFFMANGIIDDDKKRAILLSSCGSSTYSLFPSLVAPKNPGEKTYKELVEGMANHQNPKPSVIMERFKFNKRDRGPSETVAQYIAALRRLSEHCNYGTVLEDMLRDRLVCGIRDDRIQRRLLSEATMDFDRAVQIASSMERATKNLQDIQKNQEGEDMKKLQADMSPVGTCCRCGSKHLAEACRFKYVECHYCYKRGHLAKVCRKKMVDFKSRSKSVVLTKVQLSKQSLWPQILLMTQDKGRRKMYIRCILLSIRKSNLLRWLCI